MVQHCSPWGCKQLDTTEQLNITELVHPGFSLLRTKVPNTFDFQRKLGLDQVYYISDNSLKKKKIISLTVLSLSCSMWDLVP